MDFIDLGITHFQEAYRFQINLAREVYQGLAENTVLLTEHWPVITIGRKGAWGNIRRSKEYLSSSGIEVFNVDRGGDVTYHGPGQLVAYPVFKLEQEARDIHGFLESLEEVGRHFLGQYGIVSETRPGLRGIWYRGAKIGSIGIGVKKWVTFHGMAVNINTVLTPFFFIRPCGMEDVRIISLKEILGCELNIEDAKAKLRLSFKEVSLLAETVNKD